MMKSFNSILKLTVAVLAGGLILQTAAYARADADAKTRSNARHERIVGIWDVEVAIASCMGGPAFATFNAMHKYELGGTGQVVPATNPSALSAHLMAWQHVGGDNYVSRIKMYRFDPAGNAMGWTVVSNEVSINRQATEYVGSGVADFYDNNGNYLFSSCPSFAGTRFGADQ